MTSAEALKLVRGCAAAGRVSISSHAQVRMRERGVVMADIRSALCGATRCEADGAKWKATGADQDGDDLTCVVALEDGIVVVTVF